MLMLNYASVWYILTCVIDNSIALVVWRILNTSFKTNGTPIKFAQFVAKKLINRTRINKLVRNLIPTISQQ